jgi:hypothetical protein
MKLEDENFFQKRAQEHVRLEKLARKILGVDDGADLTEIKKAYWILAMKYHPDKNPRDKENLRRFLNIKNAYNFLIKGEEWNNPETDSDVDSNDSISDEYDTSNSWGYFLWWRDKFFKSDSSDDT